MHIYVPVLLISLCYWIFERLDRMFHDMGKWFALSAVVGKSVQLLLLLNSCWVQREYNEKYTQSESTRTLLLPPSLNSTKLALCFEDGDGWKLAIKKSWKNITVNSRMRFWGKRQILEKTWFISASHLWGSFSGCHVCSPPQSLCPHGFGKK